MKVFLTTVLGSLTVLFLWWVLTQPGMLFYTPPPSPPPEAPPPSSAAPEREHIILRPLLFDFEQETILEAFVPVLDEVVQFLLTHRQVSLRLEGHTDAREGKEGGLQLSKRRAAAVKHYLVERYVEAGRVETHGLSSTAPLVSDMFPDGRDNPEGRALNRRVEFKVVQ